MALLISGFSIVITCVLQTTRLALHNGRALIAAGARHSDLRLGGVHPLFRQQDTADRGRLEKAYRLGWLVAARAVEDAGHLHPTPSLGFEGERQRLRAKRAGTLHALEVCIDSTGMNWLCMYPQVQRTQKDGSHHPRRC